jgi:glycosyltransferase involved in cell wall biosynthesis
MTTFHVITNPLIPTDPFYCHERYQMKAFAIAKLLTEHGHIVHLYGTIVAPDIIKLGTNCTFYHGVVPLNTYEEARSFTNNFSDPLWMMIDDTGTRIQKLQKNIRDIFVEQVVPAIEENVNESDIIIHTCDHVITSRNLSKMVHVEIGKSGGMYCAWPNVTFESNDYHLSIIDIDPSYDIIKHSCVIHPWFDPNEYGILKPNGILDTSVKREKTYLYMARCHPVKGLFEFLKLSVELPDHTFWIAGPASDWVEDKQIMMVEGNSLDLKQFPNVVYHGIARGEHKRKLLAEATVLIQPTLYREPCGWNVIEAMLSGTPVVTPWIGGFTETVKSGVSGYLAQPNGTYAKMAARAAKLDPVACRKYAIDKFNPEQAYKKYMKFFSECKV